MASGVLDWSQQKPREVIPGFVGRFLHSDTMTFALWEIAAGSILPEHSHLHEQVVHVYEGELELTMEGQTRVLSAGGVLAIPAHVRHSGRAITGCRVMDVFHPVREDYRDGAATTILNAAAKSG